LPTNMNVDPTMQGKRSRRLLPMNRSSGILFVLFLLALGFVVQGMAANAGTHRTVALTGDHAPGTPNDVSFSNLSSRSLLMGVGPLLDAAGHTAFTAHLTEGGFPNNIGIWSEGSGSLSLVARTGTQVTGMPAGVTYTNLSDWHNASYVLTSLGHLGVIADVTGSETIGYGIWFGGGESFHLVVREGDHAPGAPDGVRFSHSPGGYTSQILGSSNRFAFFTFLEGANVDGTNDRGIWTADADSICLLAREGDQAPGMPAGAAFTSISPPHNLNAAGEVLFMAGVRGSSVSPADNEGLWAGAPDSLQLIVRKGQQAPGAPNGVSFSIFNYHGLDSAGRVAFQSQLAGNDVDSGNNDSVWMEDHGLLTLVAREGDRAPGTPEGTVFGGNPRGSSVGDGLVFSAGGQIAFQGFVTGTEVDDTNRMGIWSGRPGALELIARAGDNAPGTPGGVNFQTLLGPSMNSAGQVAFSATLVGDNVDTTNRRGIWAHNRGGELQLIARFGDLLEVAPGDFRTISGLGFFGGTGNSDGRPSGFNDRGQLAFSASFTDGSQGIFVSNLVAVPEPSSVAIVGLSMALLLWPRQGIQRCFVRTSSSRSYCQVTQKFPPVTRLPGENSL
jgi:hypothetical protein